MVLTCALGSVVANWVGLKNALIFGTTGYCVYAASLYTNNRYGNEWFVYLGATACGITAGVFWAAEGAIMIGCKFYWTSMLWWWYSQRQTRLIPSEDGIWHIG